MTGCRLKLFIANTWMLLSFAFSAHLAIADDFSVRVGYVIPSDRTQQVGAVSSLQQYLPSAQSWFRDQMQRYGFGNKTFRYETLVNGVTPNVHVVNTATTSSTIRTDIWSNTLSAASGAGLPIWTPGQVWLLIPESHLQLADGSITGGTALGASFGSGSDPGVAMLGSDGFFRIAPTMLTNDVNYAGQVVPQIGPTPFVQDVSFPWFELNTFSSIASSAQGAFAHELGHAFGLPHDLRNDANFHGNLMGNGLRGWRASTDPQRYSSDDVQLSYASALALSTSRYFNPNAVYTDNTKPTLTMTDSGSKAIAGGKLQINFTASDSSGLSAALLLRNGEAIGELPLQGTSISTSFVTPFFTKNQDDEFRILVYDSQGNRQESAVHITPFGGNVAPQPFLAVSQSTVQVGQTVRLDATNTFDPDSPSNRLFQWDLTGTGTFTSPSSVSFLDVSFATSGSRRVSVRVTDSLGAWAISTPLAIKVLLTGDINRDDIVNQLDLNVVFGNWLSTGATLAQGDANGDGVINQLDINTITGNWLSTLPVNSSAITTVPEPGGAILLSMAIARLIAARRRNQ